MGWISLNLFYFKFIEPLECILMVFIKEGTLLATTSSSTFSATLSLAFLLGFLLCLCWCTYIYFWSLFIFSSFFFLSIPQTRWPHLNSDSLISSSFASSNLLLNTSIKFFICFIILSNAKISTLLYSENNFYFFNDIVSLVTHHSVSFISLNIF